MALILMARLLKKGGPPPPFMLLRKAVFDACFEDCCEGEQGYAVLGAESLDYGEERVDDVQSRCDQVA